MSSFFADRRQSNRFLAKEWQSYIVGPDMQKHTQLADHASGGGVYFLFVRGQLTYIGESMSIIGRLAQHRRCGRHFTSYGFVNVPGDLRRSMETAYLHALHPPENNSFPEPIYLQHDRIVQAIMERWNAFRKGPASEEVDGTGSRNESGQLPLI